MKIKFSNECTQITLIKARYLDHKWWGFIKAIWVHSLENFTFTWFRARYRAKNTTTAFKWCIACGGENAPFDQKIGFMRGDQDKSDLGTPISHHPSVRFEKL